MASRTARDRLGLLAALLSAAMFATSGPFAKPLLATGWTPGALVLVRVGGAAAVLLVPTVLSMRGRWSGVRSAAPTLLTYGALAVVGAQLCYFQAIVRLTVAVALLLEYLGIVLVVLWVWATSRRAPGRLTVAGIVSSAVGLALMLDVTGSSRIDPVGVLWGLGAAVGLAAYYVLAARRSSLPPVALAGLGLGTGAVLLGLLGLVGILPLASSGHAVDLAGGTAPPWAALAELALVTAAAAYLLGIVGARALGSTVASFVGLAEVLFAVLFAWALLGELPGVAQLAGGLLILAGVVAVRLDDARRHRVQQALHHDPAVEPLPGPDFPGHAPVA